MKRFILLERRALLNTLAFIALSLAARYGAALASGESARFVEAVATLATGLGLIKLAGIVLLRIGAPAAGALVPRIVEDLTVVVACIAWGLLQLRVAGVDPASLVTTSALITGVVALSMQDTLGNVLGGILLELDHSVALGDWVRLDDLAGRVVQIRWRHTTIRTRNGERVIVPNAALIKSRFVVLGNPDREALRLRRWVWFDVDFDVPASRVIAAAEQALDGAKVANVAAEPRPDCALMELALGQCRYALRYWLTDPQKDDGTDSAVRLHVLAALERAGISPSLPKALSIASTENERQEKQRADERDARLAALRRVDLFAPLSAEELGALARHLVRAPFLAGEVITRQGAVAHWLYLLVSGEAEVWIESAQAPRRRVALLEPGTVFGEMGMLTGEPRRATVTARSDLLCYRLDKPGFEEVLRARPALAEAMSKVIASRSGGLAQAIDDAQAEAASGAARARSLVERIRSFFGIDPGADASRRAA